MFIRLTDDDIAYLTIHIGGFLKYTPSSQKNMKKVYLVCDEGVAVSRLLLNNANFIFQMSKLALYLQQNNLRVWKILHKLM